MPAGRILLKSISESKKLAALKTDSARLLYTWLIPHVDVNGCFSGDIEVLKGQVLTRLKKSDREIESYLSDLRDAGLIVRYETNGDQFIFLPSFEEKQPHLNKDREATPRIPPPTPEQIKTNSGSSLDKLPLNLNVKVKVKEKGKSAPVVAEVISYLNEKSGKNFSPGSVNSVHHITARIAEGRTIDDFRRVVDVKVSEWKGNPKMDKFLRPETLFGTKMEAYLNEKIIPAKLPPNAVDPLVGSRRRSFEEGLTDSGRRVLPQIDKEFDEKNLIEKGWDRNQYRRERLAEMFAKGEST